MPEKLSFKIGNGKVGTNERRGKLKRWKASKMMMLPSKIIQTNDRHSRSYNSFSTSRGNPSPPPDHLESFPAVDASFTEYTFDFDEGACFLPDLCTNPFKGTRDDDRESEQIFRFSSPVSDNTLGPFFGPSFPILRCNEVTGINESTVNDASHNSASVGSDEHAMSASSGIKHFESLSITSWTVPNSSSSKSLSCDVVHEEDAFEVASQNSIPSIHFSSDDNSYIDHQMMATQQDSVSEKAVSDSVIAWALLGAVIGSPAPKSVLSAKIRDNSQLWMNQGIDENCSMVNIENVAEGSTAVTVPRFDEKSIPDLEKLTPSLQHHDAHDSVSFPDFSDNIISIEQTPQDIKDATDSTIAWAALTMLLGSPAPSCVANNKRRKAESKWLWDEDACDENDQVISLAATPDDDDYCDEFSLPSLTSHDDLVEKQIFSDNEVDVSADYTSLKNDNDAANSAIMWTALAAFLSSPAPSCALGRKVKQSDNLWEIDKSIDSVLISLAHSECLNEVASSDDGDRSNCTDVDLDLSALKIDSEIPQHILAKNATLEVVQKTKDIANSTIAWTALTALLGLPAPSCVFQKKSHPGKNLWVDNFDEDDDLLSLASSRASVSVPSLVAESHIDSAPSSPSTRNMSSFESTSLQQDNAVTKTLFVEWTQ